MQHRMVVANGKREPEAFRIENYITTTTIELPNVVTTKTTMSATNCLITI
jgi:hypothetical protein